MERKPYIKLRTKIENIVVNRLCAPTENLSANGKEELYEQSEVKLFKQLNYKMLKYSTILKPEDL